MSEGNGNGNNSGTSSGAEPSMEEILASIRRILTDEESERAGAAQAAGDVPDDEGDDDILVLDSAAMVPSGQGDAAALSGTISPGPEPGGEAAFIPASVLSPAQTLSSQTLSSNEKETYMNDQVQSPEGLVGEKVANEIANTVGSLVRSVSAERAVGIGRPGVTIEDLVREEVKPVLKAWLDTHLPNLVERVVRAEIGRVIDRM